MKSLNSLARRLGALSISQHLCSSIWARLCCIQ